jgi:hypothetical protein
MKTIDIYIYRQKKEEETLAKRRRRKKKKTGDEKGQLPDKFEAGHFCLVPEAPVLHAKHLEIPHVNGEIGRARRHEGSDVAEGTAGDVTRVALLHLPQHGENPGSVGLLVHAKPPVPVYYIYIYIYILQ